MVGQQGGSAERPALFFAGPEEFRSWLEENHATSDGIWVGLYKKHVAHLGLTYREALDEALCFGWIDSVSQRIDDDTVRQRWTPRKNGSIWSRVNIAHVERLTAEGRMHPAGVAAFGRRSDARSGVYSFEQDELALPPPFEERLRDDPAAAAFWDVATPTYRKVVTAWVLDGKQEATREKRLAQLIDDSAHGRLVPPQRYGSEPKWVERAARAAREAAQGGGEGT
jgi:uncharacterized protein YdeI (YjbR/CyaY-like superfamily)